MSNNERQEALDSLSELQMQIRLLQEAYSERDELVKTYKRKYDEEQDKLTKLERRADALEIEKGSLEKQNNI